MARAAWLSQFAATRWQQRVTKVILGFVGCCAVVVICCLSHIITVQYCCRLLTDPLRIQPWSHDRRNQIKYNREHARSEKKSRHNETGKKVASKRHRRQEGTHKRQTKNKKKMFRKPFYYFIPSLVAIVEAVSHS